MYMYIFRWTFEQQLYFNSFSKNEQIWFYLEMLLFPKLELSKKVLHDVKCKTVF